ncbi:hypothetical protein FGO68_gene13063 [Halteria grandinella]|uniref:Uncharacterized protein n=1 Tax=Halteria grandinella TaxID=5974 RepID=A0A8J8P0B5_HALGN|nr:hypothetical protein FGO68_gene13063 [Halteria grandinella]
MKAPTHSTVGGLPQRTIGREWTPYHSVNEYQMCQISLITLNYIQFYIDNQQLQQKETILKTQERDFLRKGL